MLGSVLRNVAMLIAVMVVVVVVMRDHSGLMDPSHTTQTAARARSPATPRAAVRAAPVQRVAASGDRLVIEPGFGGHYTVNAEINGRDVIMLVDTGATAVSLTRDDAERIGIPVYQLEFSGRARTANGIARIAPVTLDEISLGDIRVRNVQAAVVDAQMENSLLGMSFLSRLSSFGVEDGRLVLQR